MNQNADCVKCGELAVLVASGDGESFSYKPNLVYAESELIILVDVGRAYGLVKSCGQIPTFANDQGALASLVSDNDICEQHIYHVDPSQPGLLVTFDFYNRETRSRETLNVLADGNHRAARALLEGRMFYFYYLDAKDTKSVTEGWR